VMTDEAILLWM